ncbi:hypothetical protein DD238_008061 [Peronospora effusa]|uniref:Uncharacterized protein n=1 Tax=Peronospora effusa TaxID=542832 RepID=A0A3M6VN44_9STRA|nr:hypothetical protein DD238_008061 [Peronospora effusa]RQM13165.1 hypothetical protein DD237_008154 [Peronospora effusa]
MYFNIFYAHQVNLIVIDVFKVVHVDLVARVNALTKAYNKSASKWLLDDNYRCSLELCTKFFRKCITNTHGYKVIQVELRGVSAFSNALMVDDASFVMQRESTSLADVLNMFGLLYQAHAKASQHADEL